MTRYTVAEYAADLPQDQNPKRFVINAPAGFTVVAVGARDGRPMVAALVPVDGVAVPHAFHIFAAGMVVEPLLGRFIGKVWPLILQGPKGVAQVFVAEDLPWPKAGSAPDAPAPMVSRRKIPLRSGTLKGEA